MTDDRVRQKALELIEREPTVMMLGTNGPSGTPDIKAIVKFRNDGLERLWFCSGTSCRRTEILRHDNRACLYAYEYAPQAKPIVCRGVMLSGKVELSWDDDLRRSFWSDFMTMYYPKGPLDLEFVVIQFTAESGNYYEGLDNVDFTF